MEQLEIRMNYDVLISKIPNRVEVVVSERTLVIYRKKVQSARTIKS